jgi:hypothetical protein
MAKHTTDKVRVDRAEYDALCDLRDGVHERAKVALRAEANYKDVAAVARDQANRLARQDLELTHVRAEILARDVEVARLRTENAALRAAAEQPRRMDGSLFGDVAIPSAVRR